MKRIISSILLVVLLLTCALGTLVSCKDKKKNNGPAADFTMPEGGFDTSTPIEITFYHSMGNNLKTHLEAAIKRFNAIYPNITVKHASYGDYDGVRDQIKTEISVGDQPNIAYCYPDHIALYNEAKAVQTLDVFINDATYGLDTSIFVEAFYNEGRVFGDDKTYSLPLAKSTEVIYYNRTFFEENNLTVPTTWAEMEALCAQIKTIDPDCIPLGYDSESNWFITMCEQYGSGYTSLDENDHFKFNNDTNKAFVKMFSEWAGKYYVTTQKLSGSYTSALFTGESYKNPETGEWESPTTKTYMCIGSTGGSTYQQPGRNENVEGAPFNFEVGIAPIPQVNKNNPKVISQGPSLCIFKKDNAQEVLASWLFVKFLCTDYQFLGNLSMQNGYAPAIKDMAAKDEVYAEWLAAVGDDATAADLTENITAYAARVALEQTHTFYTSPAFNGSSVARDQVGILMQSCLLAGQQGLSEAELKARIDAAFRKAIEECEYQAGE